MHVSTAARPVTQADIDEALICETETKVGRALPVPQHEAVVLPDRHGRAYRQVARDLDIPEETAKSRLRVALASLADRLESEGIVER